MSNGATVVNSHLKFIKEPLTVTTFYNTGLIDQNIHSVKNRERNLERVRYLNAFSIPETLSQSLTIKNTRRKKENAGCSVCSVCYLFLEKGEHREHRERNREHRKRRVHAGNAGEKGIYNIENAFFLYTCFLSVLYISKMYSITIIEVTYFANESRSQRQDNIRSN